MEAADQAGTAAALVLSRVGLGARGLGLVLGFVGNRIWSRSMERGRWT